MTGKFDILKEYFYGSALFGVNYENNNAYRIIKFLNFMRNKYSSLNKHIPGDVDSVLHTNRKMSPPDFVARGSQRIVELLRNIEKGKDVKDSARSLRDLLDGNASELYDFEEYKRNKIVFNDEDMKRFKYLFENHQLAVSTLITLGA